MRTRTMCFILESDINLVGVSVSRETPESVVDALRR